MQIMELGYVGIAATSLDAWRSFAGDFLGMQVVAAPGRPLALRMDQRMQRFLIVPDSRDRLAFCGFEVRDEAALRDAASELTARGLTVRTAEPHELELRHVAQMVWVCDPDGHRVEVFHGPEMAVEPFCGVRPTGGFRTGELGLGHVVLKTTRFAEMEAFYRDLMGLRLSDYLAAAPFRATFLHTNPRHHSVALIESTETQLHHVMVEYNFVDDVGRLYDMALAVPDRIGVTLGRHSNDHMLSFYAKTPGGFMIEAGWAGRLIDDRSWQPGPLEGPSIWGHERSWLPPDARLEARKCLEAAARKGTVEPTEVVASPGFKLPERRP